MLYGVERGWVSVWNRLAIIATDQDTDAMLDHALAHLHLRS
jgi:hypothetical protein